MKRTSLLVAALLTIAPVLHAQTAPTPAQIAERLVQRYAILLGLSSTVQEQAVTIFTTDETAQATLRTSERTAHTALDAAIKAANTATITTLSATLGELSGESTLAHSTAEAQFYAILTSDQQTKYAQMLTRGPGGPGGGPGGSGGGPGGPPPQQ